MPEEALVALEAHCEALAALRSASRETKAFALNCSVAALAEVGVKSESRSDAAEEASVEVTLDLECEVSAKFVGPALGILLCV